MRNLVGEKVGRLVVVDNCEHITKKGKTVAGCLCKCDCGKTKITARTNILSGQTRSCGCLIRELNETKIGNNYGELTKTTYQPVHHKRLKDTWKNMKARCFNKKKKEYKNYGGRGITVCAEWSSNFMSFYEWAMVNGYRSDLTIDRIDVNGNYEPSNCRWATDWEQRRNTRRNHYITIDGITKVVADWSKELGIPDYKVVRIYEKRNSRIYNVRNERPVIQVDIKTGEQVGEYKSIVVAAKAIKLKSASNITQCCKGLKQSVGGYKWAYKEDRGSK